MRGGVRMVVFSRWNSTPSVRYPLNMQGGDALRENQRETKRVTAFHSKRIIHLSLGSLQH